MGIFGWSLPPGVTTLPGEEEYPCEVCGEFPDNCICPECPVCSDAGNPSCYPMHGLHRTFEQKWNFACRSQEWEIENWNENQFWSEIEKQRKQEGDWE